MSVKGFLMNAVRIPLTVFRTFLEHAYRNVRNLTSQGKSYS